MSAETHDFIQADGVELPVDLVVPEQASGIVVFAHGSGSSRQSPRNLQVAAALRAAGRFGTLLFDLLTAEEDVIYRNRFEIALLTGRLTAAITWLEKRSGAAALPVGLFGASTGAAAALQTAAALPEIVRAVVSRGGRPDLAMASLPKVRVPTLLLVGGLDYQVIELNQRAFEALGTREKHLTIVPGATHLFEEPGTLDEVVRLTYAWFERYLRAS